MPTSTAVDEAHFQAQVVESELPVVVDFWAAWCGPCRVMHPILDQLARERDDVRFVSVDVDTEQGLAARYGVLSMPTFLVLKAGEPVARIVGSRSRARFAAELDAALGGAV